MKKTVITADSGLAVNYEGVSTIPLTIIDTDTGTSYLDQAEISIKEVYALRGKGHRVTTSCINLFEAEAFFRKQLEDADQIIHLCMTDKVSLGSLVSTQRAAAEIDPSRIRVINTLQGGAGGPVVAREALKAVQQEDNLDTLVAHMEKGILPRIKTGFLVPDPAGYKASGKGILNGFINMGISAFSAGSGLPVIKLTPAGSMLPTRKLRLKAGENMYVAYFKSQFDPDRIDGDYISAATLMPDEDLLQVLKDYTATNLPHMTVDYCRMGAVISVFACYDALGISYLVKA